MTTEGFYTNDIVEHLTDEFTLECLTMGEGVAIVSYEWGDMSTRFCTLRNALIGVALEAPLSALRPSSSLDTYGVGLPATPELHVLILDTCPQTRELHRTLVRRVRPQAQVHAVSRCTQRP